MKIGFTGTRDGMTDAQQSQLRYVLALFIHADRIIGQVTEFLDGDCPDGADREARAIAVELGCVSVLHRPKTWTAPDLLARNRDIARECHVGIAAPNTDKEQLRSGTWSTVRYMRKEHKPVVMLSRGAPGQLPLRRQNESYRA